MGGEGWGGETRKGGGGPSSQGNAQAPETRSKLPPCSFSSHTNSQSQEQSFHLQSLPHISLFSQLWSQVERLCWHMPVLVYELVTTSKAAWPKACPLFKGDLSNFKMGPFLGLCSRHWGGLTLPTASSLDSTQGLLWGLYSQGAVNVVQHERTFYPPIRSREKWKILC